MKFKEYWSLAKLSLKNNKKTTRSTILGQVFGFLFLIPIILIVVGINTSIEKELDKYPGYNYYQLGMADYRIDTKDDYFSWNLSGSEHLEEFLAEPYTSSKIVYESYEIGFGSTLALKSDKKNQSYDFEGRYEDAPIPMNIWDSKINKSLFPKSINAKNAFLYGGQFEGDGKGQVIVSEYYLNLMGLEAKDVYNKYLTLYYDEYPYYVIDNGLGEDERYVVFKDFKVVGIIKKSITEEYFYPDNTDDQHYMGGMMYFCDTSVYDSNGNGMLKEMYNSEGEKIIPNFDDRQRLLDESYMMLTNSYYWRWNDLTTSATIIYCESNSMSKLNEGIVYVNSITNKINPEAVDMMVVSSTYSTYWWIYQSSNLICLAFLAVSFVILVCTIINFYCSTTHDIERRRHYLTLMRAVGAKDRVIPRLYMTEALVITLKTSIAIAVCGSVLGIIVKLVLDQIIETTGIFITITIPWWLVFVVVACSIVFTIAISVIISWLCSYRLSKRRITDILNNE